MANKTKSTNETKEAEVKEQSIQYVPESQERNTDQGEVINVSATTSTMNINRANSSGSQITEAEMKREVEAAKRQLDQQKTKAVTIPKQMAQYTGDTMIACINGACVRVPVDGNSYDIPEAYHDIIMNSLKTIHAGDVRDAYGFGDKVNDDALVK